MSSGAPKTRKPGPHVRHDDICQVIAGEHAGAQVRIIAISPLLTPIMYTCRIVLGLHRGDQILVAEHELSNELEDV